MTRCPDAPALQWLALYFEIVPRGSNSVSLTYRLDENAEILYQTWRGNVAVDDVLRFWTHLINARRTLRYGRHLNDMRRCQFAFSGNVWVDLVSQILERMPPHASWKAAIAVDRPDMHGVVRQFIGYAGELVTAEIFDNMDEATEWLTRGV